MAITGLAQPVSGYAMAIVLVALDAHGAMAIAEGAQIAIRQLARQQFEARLRIGTHTLFFYFRCGHGSLWYEGGYSPWRGAAAGSRLYSEPAPNTGVMLKICLVDSTTGILRGMRATFLGEGFSRAVLSACKDILAKPANDDEHMREVGEQAQIPLGLAAAQAPLRFRTKDSASGR